MPDDTTSSPDPSTPPAGAPPEGQPQVLEGPTPVPAPAGDGEGEDSSEQVTSPTKLIRIASMVRTMLDEVRHAPLDEAGRRRLREIYERTMGELQDVLSEDLREELLDMVLPFSADAPSESELRLAQAQLVGWLEGLFHGIQATLFQQQVVAQSQLEEMRRRAALEAGAGQGPTSGSGQYL